MTREEEIKKQAEKKAHETQEVECLHCHSLIEYDTMKVEHEQIMDKYYPYIICPFCNEQIMLGREKGGKQ